jgi:hypothetical protein
MLIYSFQPRKKGGLKHIYVDHSQLGVQFNNNNDNDNNSNNNNNNNNNNISRSIIVSEMSMTLHRHCTQS